MKKLIAVFLSLSVLFHTVIINDFMPSYAKEQTDGIKYMSITGNVVTDKYARDVDAHELILLNIKESIGEKAAKAYEKAVISGDYTEFYKIQDSTIPVCMNSGYLTNMYQIDLSQNADASFLWVEYIMNAAGFTSVEQMINASKLIGRDMSSRSWEDAYNNYLIMRENDILLLASKEIKETKDVIKDAPVCDLISMPNGDIKVVEKLSENAPYETIAWEFKSGNISQFVLINRRYEREIDGNRIYTLDAAEIAQALYNLGGKELINYSTGNQTFSLSPVMRRRNAKTNLVMSDTGTIVEVINANTSKNTSLMRFEDADYAIKYQSDKAIRDDLQKALAEKDSDYDGFSDDIDQDPFNPNIPVAYQKDIVWQRSINEQEAVATKESAVAEEVGEEVEEKIKEINTNDFDDYADAVFIGDSLTVGLSMYIPGLKESSTFLCKTSANVYSIMDSESEDGIGIRDNLENNKYNRVYILLGINEIGSNQDEFISQYKKVIEEIRELQPFATIYLQSILPVTEVHEAEEPVFNNNEILARNTRLAALANGEDILYLDIREDFETLNGTLREDMSSDGIHLLSDAYIAWFKAISK